MFTLIIDETMNSLDNISLSRTIGEPHEITPARRIEIMARRCGDVLIMQQGSAKIRTVLQGAADIGVEVERAIGG